MKQLRYLLLILITITFTTSCLVSEGNTDFAYKHVQIPELEKWSVQHIVAQQQAQVKKDIQQYIAESESQLKKLSDIDKNKNIACLNYLKEKEHLQHLRQKRISIRNADGQCHKQWRMVRDRNYKYGILHDI